MFIIKKILSSLLLPPGIFIIVLLCLGLWFLFKRHWKAGMLLFIMSGLMWAGSTAFFSDYLLRGLEAGLQVPENPKGDIIILLDGGASGDVMDFSGRGAPSEDTLVRIVTATRIQKKLGVPILVSGRILFHGKFSGDVIAKRFLIDLGVPSDKIFLEGESKDTLENAKFSKEIISKTGYRKPVLVTSALHMKRSILCFEKNGVNVIPYPAYLKTSVAEKYILTDYLPGDFYVTQRALHEYVGLLYTKLVL